jgi:hypothetical protein
MSTRRSIWAVVAAAVTITGSAIPGRGDDAREFKYSGTVVAIDQGAGTMIVEGMGPWRVKDGVTQLERRTVGVAPAAEFVRIERATGAAPSGWAGDFIESALPRWQVKAGDWVTVAGKRDGGRMTAIRIDVGEPGGL